MNKKIMVLQASMAMLVLVVFYFLAGTALAQSPVTITFNPEALSEGITVSPEFTGLSFETRMVLANGDGKYYFSPENKPLIAMFKMLGIKSLRLGGNTADRETVKVPTQADIDNLFAFAKAAGVKVIYTLRMNKGDPKLSAELAKYIMDNYRSDLTCLAIGNEPNVFAKEYPVYRDMWKKYMEVIVEPANAPDARFCGPSATPGKVLWARDFANDLGPSGRIALIVQHDYPGGSARKVTDVAVARDNMLSPDWVKYNEKFYNKFVPAATANHLPVRLEEANSYFYGGAKDVSDTFASALWALDYMYWWASRGIDGINFHTGDNPNPGPQTAPSIYATYTTTAGGYSVHPIGYAMKAFDLGKHGRIVPVNLANNVDGINMTAYAVSGRDKNLYFTLINKEHGSGAHDAKVTIAPSKSWANAQVMYLAVPNGDVSVTSGVTLGCAEIKDDASWKGAWTPVASHNDNGDFTVKVPAATAAVVKLTAK